MDIYSDDVTFMSNGATDWKIQGLINSNAPVAQACGSAKILGGPGIVSPSASFEVTYRDIGPHTVIYYSMPVIVVDNWATGDTITLYIDQHPVNTWEPAQALSSSNEGEPLCGSNIKDDWSIYVGKLDHTATSVTIKFSSQITSNTINKWFGIRALRLIFAQKTLNDFEEAGVISLYANNIPSMRPCKIQTYQDPSNPSICLPCDTGCKNCFGPGPDQCYGCSDGYFYNGIKCALCSSHCTACSGSGKTQCTWCSASYTLFWDNSCRTGCVSPYLLSYLGQCQTPCQSLGLYMSWKDTCIPSCSTPLTTRIEGPALFCDFGCNAQAGDYLYWDGSCSSACTLFDLNKEGYKFCSYCPLGQYMYPDQTCRVTCASPYKERQAAVFYFCDSPCEDDRPYYYTTYQDCRPTCEYPYKNSDNMLCVIDLSKNEASLAKNIATTNGVLSQTIAIASKVVNFVQHTNPAALYLNMITSLLDHIKYLDIQFSPRLEQTIEDGDSLSFSLIPNMPQSWVDRLPDYIVPSVFQRRQLSSSFIVNFWNSEVTFLILVIAVTATLITPLTKKWRPMHKYLTKAQEILIWNFVIITIAGSFDGLALFSALEFQSVQSSQIRSMISLAICLLSNMILLLLFSRMIMVILSVQKHSTPEVQTAPNAHTQPLSQHHLKKYEILWKTYKDHSLSQRLFMCIFIARIYLVYTIIGYLFRYPLLQTILILLISIFMAAYILISRPFQAKTDLVQSIIQEAAVIVINTCAVVNAYLDSIDSKDYTTRNIVSNIIIYTNIAFRSLVSVYMLANMAIMIQKLYFVAKAIVNAKRARNGVINVRVDRIDRTIKTERQESQEKPSRSSDIAPISDLSSATLKEHDLSYSRVIPADGEINHLSNKSQLWNNHGHSEEKTLVDDESSIRVQRTAEIRPGRARHPKNISHLDQSS